MTKIGILVNGTMSTVQKIGIAQSLGTIYSRIPIYAGYWPYTPTAYNQWVTAGFNIILNINWLPTGGTPIPFRTASELAAYGATVNAILTAISTPEIVVIENEEINPNYHSGPMSDYVGMLATASPIVHSFGLKVANGGIYGAGLDVLAWRYFDSISDFVQRDYIAQGMTPGEITGAANPGSNLTLEAKAQKVQDVLDASTYLDYINIHPYEVLDEYVADPSVVTNITPGIVAGYQAFILAETGLPTMTNETGQRDNSQPDLVTNMLTEYVDLGFDYVVWFDGVGSGGATALQAQTSPFDLFANGIAFRDFVFPTDNTPTVIIDNQSPTTLYLPDNSLAVTATVTPGYLHSIASVLWTYISGPATYTITTPSSSSTTFADLVSGSYTFNITVTQDDDLTASDQIIINVIPTQTGVKYVMRFLNRQKDIYRVELKPKNYSNIDIQVEGTDTPFILKAQSGDGDIYSPIRASEATISFWSQTGIEIENFYNDDDTFWQVFFYGEKINGEVTADVLLWTGFLQMDNSGEALQDYAHPITLNANDNLGLLKNVTLPTPTDTQRYEGMLLTDLFASILQQTTLSLETRAYLNVFENSTQDRSDIDTIDFLQQTVVYTNNLQNTDGTYKKCYEILSDLLFTFRSQLQQCFGEWVIFRQGEFRLFADAEVPGTLYDADFAVQDAIVLDPPVLIGKNEDIIPINENLGKRILRPLQYSKKTFTYNQPSLLIIQSDLSLPPDAVPYNTHVDGDLQYQDYDLDTYFPDWRRQAGDTSYLEVVTDTITENETSRYIVTPGGTGIYGAITFNNIPVSQNDQFDFSFQFRTFADTGDPVRFYCNFSLLDTNGMYWYVLGFNVFQNSSTNLQWIGPVSSLPVPFVQGPETSIPDTFDNSQWTQYVLSELPTDSGSPLVIPVDGILLVACLASNGPDDNTHPDLLWNNIRIEFKNAVNTQTIITAQVHNNAQDSATKNISDTDLNFDDSPLNTINGTLFRIPLVNFASPVGDLYFYRTNRWHRAAIDESWRLNQIQTFDELFIQRKIRTIVEGDWFGLRYQVDGGWQYLTLQNILKINFLEGLNFIFGIVSFDYMKGEFTATLYECFDDGETDSDLSNTYTFTYLYKTN